MSDAPRLQERPSVSGGKLRAAIAGQLNGDPLGAEEGTQARNEALDARGGGAVYVDPSGEAVGADQVVRAIQVEVVRRDALDWRRGPIGLDTRILLERRAVAFAGWAHRMAVGDVGGDAWPEH